jgi:hypothetical protein
MVILINVLHGKSEYHMPCFLRRRLGVQASQGPGRPGRLVNPRLIRFSLYFSHFLSFFTDIASPCLALYSPRRLEGG